MFDFAFSELMVVGVIALVVLGPERLPLVARQLGRWISRMRRYVDDVKSDLNREIDLAELRKLQSEVKDAASSFKGSVESALSDTRQSLQSIESSLDPGAPRKDASLHPDGGALESASADTNGTDETTKPTDWDAVYATRRTRNRLRDRRIESERARGHKRPRRPLHR